MRVNHRHPKQKLKDWMIYEAALSGHINEINSLN